MKNIDTLFAQLNKIKSDSYDKIQDIREKLQAALNAVFDDWKALQDAIMLLGNSDQFCFDCNGELIQWVRFYELSKMPVNHREFLQEYLQEKHCIAIDFANDMLTAWQGDDDHYTIQDDTRHNNGVWLNSKLVIREDAYRDENGELDGELRNSLIEEHMETHGYFPGVFHVDCNGNVKAINTTLKEEK